MVTKPQIELAVEQSVGETKINSFGLEGKATLWGEEDGATSWPPMGPRYGYWPVGWQTCLVIYQTRPLVIYCLVRLV